MTNHEWLKSLGIEDMAKMMGDDTCAMCFYNRHAQLCPGKDCKEGIAKWLNAEHKKPMPKIKEGDMFVYMQSQIPFYGACVYGNIVYLPGEERCCYFGEEIKEKIIAIKRYNIAKGMMEDIWRADNGKE